MFRTARVIFLAFAALAITAVQAQSPAATKNTVRILPSAAGKDTVRIGGIDCRITPCGADIIDRAVNQHPTVKTDGGLPKLEADGTARNPSGNPVPVKATARVGGAAAAKAIGRAAVKILPGTSTAIAIAELADELGFKWRKEADNSIVVTKADADICTTAPCYEYSPSVGIWTSPGAACKARMVTMTNGDATYNYMYSHHVAGSGAVTCYGTAVRRTNGTVTALSPFNLAARVGTPAPTNQTPATHEEFLDSIATKSGWPAASKVSAALAEASNSTGESIEVIPSTQILSGPSSSPGTSSTTNNTTDNSTTTNTTTHNHSYAGDTITTTNSTNSVTINNTTGSVTNNTTTNSTAAPAPQEIETCGLPGKPPCKLDETGTPDGKDALKKDDFEAKLLERETKLTDVTSATGKDTSWGVMPNWTQQGACSAWHIYTLPSALGARSVDLDLCPIKPYADGAANFIWCALAFFGITSMVFATMTSKGT